MKQDVALKRKSYRCVCWTDAALTGPNDPRLKKLDQIKDLTVMQRTPIRVLHRSGFKSITKLAAALPFVTRYGGRGSGKALNVRVSRVLLSSFPSSRSLLTRKKTVYSARAEYINPHWFLLDVLTSAGAYVKEFVHGDRGRTVPSVGSIIGARATIIQLDVIGVSNQQQREKREGNREDFAALDPAALDSWLTRSVADFFCVCVLGSLTNRLPTRFKALSYPSCFQL